MKKISDETILDIVFYSAIAFFFIVGVVIPMIYMTKDIINKYI